MADKENDSGHLLLKWRWAVLRSELPAPSKLVLHTLGFYMDLDGTNCQVGQTRLTRDTGLGVSTIRRHLSGLEAVGWISVERLLSTCGDPEANRYHPAIPSGLEVVPEREGLGQEREGGSSRAGGGALPERAPTSKRTSKKTSYVYPAEFETVWAIHHRGAKKAAFAEWKKAVPDLLSQPELETALRAYCRTFKGDFTGQHLNRWIRDERWEELQAGQPTGSGTGRLARV